MTSAGAWFQLVETVQRGAGSGSRPGPEPRSAQVLDSLESGEIDVEEALRRLS